MKRKISEYLDSKAESEYDELDKIFREYINGNIKAIADTKGFTKVEIFPEISKKTRSIQIYFRYYNFAGFIEFENDGYEYCLYVPDRKQTIFDEKNILKRIYSYTFSIDSLFDELYNQIINDKRLDKKDCLIKNKKYKKYKALSNISLLIPGLVILILGLYVIITDKSLYVPILGVISISGIIFHLIFYCISTKYQ